MKNLKLNITSKVLLLTAGLIVFYLYYAGNQLVPQLRTTSLLQYIELHGPQGALLFMSFTFAFPLAIHLIVLACLLNQKDNRGYALLVSVFVAIAATFVIFWPFIVGRQHSWLYFAIGGSICLLMTSLVAWFWTRQRLTVEPSQRLSVDFLGAALFFFALVTWNLCGAMGMPGYALYPERSISVNGSPFIIGQVKVIMLYLVFAWSALAMSYWLRQKTDH